MEYCLLEDLHCQGIYCFFGTPGSIGSSRFGKARVVCWFLHRVRICSSCIYDRPKEDGSLCSVGDHSTPIASTTDTCLYWACGQNSQSNPLINR